LAVVVLTRGAFSTTFTSSTRSLATSMTMFSSAGALMPTFTFSWTWVFSLGASVRTWKVPGSRMGKRKKPSSLV
jgi:hypothetical protein